MRMKTAEITVKIKLSWDPRQETARGALAATFLNMGEGVANGTNGGPLPNRGTWELRSDPDHVDKIAISS